MGNGESESILKRDLGKSRGCECMYCACCVCE